MSLLRFTVWITALAVLGCSGDPKPRVKEGAHPAESGHESHEEDALHSEEHGDEHEDGEPDSARIDPATASQHGIAVEAASAGPISETLTLTGQLIIDPKR